MQAVINGIIELAEHAAKEPFDFKPEDTDALKAEVKKAVGADTGEKASCHSDYVDPDAAQAVQGEKVGKLVQVNLEPAFNIPSGDRTV
jgi:polyribonucleotide nucleotidyltransferase